MKTRSKMIMLVCLLMVMSTSLLGCGKNDNKPENANPDATNAGGTGGEKLPPMDISFLTYANSPFSQTDSADAIKQIEEYTNTKLNLQIVPSTGGEEKLNVTIASGDMPTLLATVVKNSTIINAARAGAFWEIGDLIKDYPYFSEINSVVYDNISIDGKVYGLPRTRPLIRPVLAYRTDILKELGMKEPETPDELFEVLTAVKQKYPDMTPLMDIDGNADWTLYPFLFQSFGTPNKWEVNAAGEFIPYFESPGYTEAMKYHKKLYDAGLLNEDFAVAKQSDKDQRVRSGNAFAFIQAADSVNDERASIRSGSKNENADLDFIVSLKDASGKMTVRALPGHNGMLLFPKSKIKDEAQLKRVLDFVSALHDPEMANLLEYGIEGKNYELKDGAPVLLDRQDYLDRITNLKTLLSRLNFNTTVAEKTELQKKGDSVSADYIDFAISNPADPLYSDTFAQKGSQLERDLIDTMIRYSMGVTDEAGLKKALQDWYSKGGTQIAKEFAEQLAKQKQ
ncbi:extracellular solute-binding protein [Paenibacillus luteus]|uniref:extracellular solute-binding protein n=1 Tax=Paenibacillus luteus TaxID=2545753 RepID=UPI0011412443|nr:extracellular solute-binding protein [Paenibacillus luteus]